MTHKLTIAASKKIARSVLVYRHSGIDPRDVHMTDEIDRRLAEIGLGWVLKEGADIDGGACQFIGELAPYIRLMAVPRQ